MVFYKIALLNDHVLILWSVMNNGRNPAIDGIINKTEVHLRFPQTPRTFITKNNPKEAINNRIDMMLVVNRLLQITWAIRNG